MIPAASGNQNQITVLLRVDADQQSAAAARSVAKQVQELHTSVIKDLERKRSEAARQEERERQQALRQQRDAASETRREQKGQADERRREQENEVREAQQHASRLHVADKLRAKAAKEATEEATRQQQVVRESNAAMIDGGKQALSGVTALARGFALLGASSEEETERAARAVAQFEIGVQAVGGLIDTVQGGVKAWRAYEAAVKAAAAAQAALSVAQGASASGNAVGSIAGNVAGGAGTKAVGSGLAGLLGSVGRIVLTSPTTILAAGAALNVYARSDAGKEAIGPEGWLGFLSGSGTLLGSLADARAQMEGRFGIGEGISGVGHDSNDPRGEARAAAERSRRLELARAFSLEQEANREMMQREQGLLRSTQTQVDAARAGRAARAGLSGTEGDLAGIRGQFSVHDRAQQEVSALRARDPRNAALAEEEFARMQEIINLREREKQAVDEIGRTRLASLDQEIAKLQTQKDQQQSILDAMKSSLQSAEERFAHSSPEVQQQLRGANRALVSGGDLSLEQEKILASNRDLLGRQGREALDARIRGRAEAAAVGEISGERRGDITNQEGIVANISAQIDFKHDLKVELSRNHDDTLKELGDKLSALIDESERRVLALAEQRFRQSMSNAAFQRRHAAGG